MATNRASLAKGAVATGTGTNVNNMFDDTEATNWTGLAPAASSVTVDLQGGVQNVKRVNVSAMLNPENGGRFRALRQFEIWTCNGNAVACALPTNFTKIYTSPADAFPGVRPRPTGAGSDPAHVRRARHQRHARAAARREQPVHGDRNRLPRRPGRRSAQRLRLRQSGSDADLDVKAAELQVFSSTPNLPPADPAVLVTVEAPATAAVGSQFTYTISYTNGGPAESTDAKLIDTLPAGLKFISASDGGTYNGIDAQGQLESGHHQRRLHRLRTLAVRGDGRCRIT